ncbi:MAG: hypothetical protein J6D52_04335 [Clostridia bacterium]|nr:hypothetical protein [Clostridia bacterium]
MEQLKYNSLSPEEMIKLHDNKERQFKKSLKKWNRMGKFSSTMQLIGILFCLAAAGYFYYEAHVENLSWIMKIVGIAIGAASGVVAVGALFLILKPIFWMVRKKAKEKLPSIDEAEKELLLIKAMIIQHCEANHKTTYTKDNYQKLRSLKSSKELSSEWIKHQTNITELSAEVRSLSLDSDKYNEWKWVLSAVVVIIGAITFAVAITLFVVFIGIAITIIAAICSSNRRDRSYGYRNYNDYDYDDGIKKESLFETIVHAITGKVWAYSDFYMDLISKRNSAIYDAKKENKKIMSQLQVWNYPKLKI